MLNRHALAGIALVNVLALSSVAYADDPPPPPAPKAAVGPAPSDVQPSVATGTSPPSAEPDRPMRHDRGDRREHGDHEGGGAPVTVTVTSDRPHAMLFRSTSTSYVASGQGGALTMTNVRSFVPVCAAPCTVTTDDNATYRIGGEGVALSDEFRLPSGQGSTYDLKVHGGSLAARRGGAALIGGGVTALVAGGALILAGYVSRPDYTDAKYVGEPRYLKNDLDSSRGVRTAGFIIAPIGALFVLTGAVLSAVGRTTVETGSTKLATTTPSLMPKLTLDGLGVTF